MVAKATARFSCQRQRRQRQRASCGILVQVSGPSSSRALLVGLSASLAVALIVIAFLLGRESARGPAAETTMPAPLVVKPEPAVEEVEQRRWPRWADLDEWEDVEAPAFAAEPVGERLEHRPDGTLLLSNRGSTADAPRVTSDSTGSSTGSAVSDYFLRMDLIQSESGAGDPNTFAMGLIKAGLGGSTSGFDRLIADTQRMEEQIRSVAPPPSCEGYHDANLKALAESRNILEDMKTAFARREFSQITAIAQQAGTLQVKAKALQEMRERIIAQTGR